MTKFKSVLVLTNRNTSSVMKELSGPSNSVGHVMFNLVQDLVITNKRMVKITLPNKLPLGLCMILNQPVIQTKTLDLVSIKSTGILGLNLKIRLLVYDERLKSL